MVENIQSDDLRGSDERGRFQAFADAGFQSAVKDVKSAPGGAVTAEVRLVVREGVSKAEAFKALQTISNALVGDAITLE
jgi:hypothetical protein